MSQSNFEFLEEEFAILFNLGQSAEYNLYADPNVTLVKMRQFGEKMLGLIFENYNIPFPSLDNFNSRLKTLEFERVLQPTIRDLFNAIRKIGNEAAHEATGTVQEGKTVLFSAFKLGKWFYESFSVKNADISQLKFKVPENLDARHALKELEGQFKELELRYNQLLEKRETQGIPEPVKQEIFERSAKAASKIEMSEVETRELIDAQLRLAGWEADTLVLNFKKNKTIPERNKKIAISEWPVGGKWADYALFNGFELYGIVEAKKYAHDISTDLRQSKIYAELAEEKYGAKLLGEWQGYKVPFLFSTNGRPYLEQIKTKSGVWFFDVRNPYNTARALQGWQKPEGLVKLFQQDIARANQKMENTPLDFLQSKSGLGLRGYQVKAIQAIEQTLINEPEKRRALIAMATGTGKTRTIIGLCYQLIQTNRFNRILFLVDRTLLGIQAINAFKDNKVVGLNTFAEVYDVKNMQEAVPDIDTRLQFATVQGMVKRLFYNESGDVPTIDQYDCIIIDEAHRGYLLDKELDEEDLDFKDQMDYVSKYRKVLDYFDAYSIGLTATPALHTHEIFGSPVYTYSFREAVVDGYLIDQEPPYIIQTKLNQEGIKWEKGEKPKAFDKENNSIVELEELPDELNIDVVGFNKKVLTEPFNRTVVKQLVKVLDPDGEEKTLIFAATDEHADTIVQMLKEEFQAVGIDVHDSMIEKITGKSYDPEQQVKRFKNEKYPNIAVTVDLLTTGIDVPTICNLVFLRRVKSRILYDQMLGRATRRADHIGKETFKIYDAVGIYEALKDYTQMQPVVANPKSSFTQLTEELKQIERAERATLQIEQILAKLQRKKLLIEEQKPAEFNYLANGNDPDDLIEYLRNQPVEQSAAKIIELSKLWKFLDEFRPLPKSMLISFHDDEFRGMERGYGKGKRPEDYLESFSKYIQENQNKIAALNIICTSPKELDRKSLRELLITLAHDGFDEVSLKAAWKEAKNEDIAADIISFIRTLAVGNALLSQEERIKGAIAKVRKIKKWSAIQEKWIERFEKQLLKESVLQPTDLDEDPFNEAGGYQRLNKIFENRLEEVINTINENLYNQSA
ncbi:type I restriction-modification system endonuclease [Desertivirga xinjiangensis]|uniref:type I restriction-modification system endonuclease n=1 Tax=Desertivirga xinjiangensis TaxID=539206 RepID=UPI00210AF097|nr:type I restriction-modification system endonuclease [Pedobacter xinjiangensis]